MPTRFAIAMLMRRWFTCANLIYLIHCGRVCGVMRVQKLCKHLVFATPDIREGRLATASRRGYVREEHSHPDRGVQCCRRYPWPIAQPDWDLRNSVSGNLRDYHVCMATMAKIDDPAATMRRWRRYQFTVPVRVTPDGKFFAYSYDRALSCLYLVAGVK